MSCTNDYTFKLNKNVEFKVKSTNNQNIVIYKEVVLPRFKINCKSRDQWFLTDNGEICKFEYSKNHTIYARIRYVKT